MGSTFSFDEGFRIKTKIHLFEGGSTNECLELDDNCVHDLIPWGLDDPFEPKLIYNAHNGMVMQLRGEEDDRCPNKYYQLVCNDSESNYKWKSIDCQYRIGAQSLMCNLNQSIFIWNGKHGNYLYNFERAAWQELPRSLNKDMTNMKDLYFDSMKQRVFCTAAVADADCKESFDIAKNRWVYTETRVRFEYFNTIRHRWYRHPPLDISHRSESCKAWRDPGHSNIMYLDLWTGRDKHYVYFFDDRSNRKQWAYDLEKTQELTSLNVQGSVGLVTSCNSYVKL